MHACKVKMNLQGGSGAVGHHGQRLRVGENVLWKGGCIQTLEDQVALLISKTVTTF